MYFRYVFLLLIGLTILSIAKPTYTVNAWDSDLNEILDDLDKSELEKQMDDFTRQYGYYIPSDIGKDEKASSFYTNKMSGQEMIRTAILFFFQEVIAQRYMLTMLVIIVILSSMIQHIQNQFEGENITRLSNYIIYLFLYAYMFHSFYLVCMYGKNALEQMNSFMLALLPLLISIVALYGQVLTISFFQPIVIFLIYSTSTLITRIIFPLLFLAALLHLISYLHDSFQVTQLAHIFKKVSFYILGIFTSLFFGVLSVQGTVTAIGDGITVKAAKFMTSNFVPVIGRTVTEGIDTLISASLLAKNAIGLFGLIMLLLILLFPVLKMLAIAFIYQIVAALLQPISSDQSITSSLALMSKYMFYILACILVMASLYFITLLFFIVSTNMPLIVK